MKNSIYALRKTDKMKIKNLAERIFQVRESLIGRTIGWDDFTEKYMKLPIPNTDLERIQCVQYRTTWIDALNKEMVKQKYACKLFVVFNQGISILINGSASELTIRKRTRKISNVLGTTIEAVDDLKECFPEAAKLLEAYSKITIENLYAFSGRIDNSKLPQAIKRELKKIIQKSLPPSEE